MNQEIIGSFISKLRREQNITQKELADKIGVSDKTISKWETGKSVPDITYIEAVCTALDITMNELISGERLSKEAYSVKAEENLLNLIEENETSRKRNLIAIAIGVVLLIASLSMIIFYGYGNEIMRGLLFYLDPLTFIIITFLSLGCVLISGKRSFRGVIGVLRRISLPCGCLITLITLILVLANLDDPASIGPTIAVSILSMVYAFIEYIVVILIQERMIHDKD